MTPLRVLKSSASRTLVSLMPRRVWPTPCSKDNDSTSVATQQELFFMYSMAKNKSINVDAFTTDYLGKVGRADFEGISVGDMITQIVEHFRY